MTAKKILIEWLKQYVDKTFYYQDLERRIVDYGVNYYGKLHNAGSYSRVFRTIKGEDQKELKSEGIYLIEDFQSNGVGRWMVAKFNT